MALIDVITYEGSNDVLVYKYPHTEFNTLSQLEVHESQEAIFFRDGKMLDSFGPGRYTLHTGNIPILSKLINLPTGGESPFRCEVYFVNKALTLNYKWGTQSKTRVMDNQFHLLLELGASGTVGLKVVNPRMLLGKIVGTELALSAEVCLNYFRENISAKVKEYLSRVMQKPEMNFLLLDTYLNDFSIAVKGMLDEVFSDVGVELYNFIIGTISIPDEQYQVIMQGQQDLQRAQYGKQLKRIEAEGDAESQTILAQGRAKSRQIEGYNWVDEQIAEITKIYAGNSNMMGNPASMIAQAPMAMAFGNMLRGNLEPIMGMEFSNPPMNFKMQNDNEVQKNDRPDDGFSTIDIGGNMYEDIQPDNTDEISVDVEVSQYPVEILKQLKTMLDLDLITQSEYDAKKAEILNKMC